jgi:pimeloyl-ACP methyl ester carboxylesterase
VETTSIYRSAEGRRRVLAAYDDLLAGWPLPLERLTLATALGQTLVLACGPVVAPPLVLLHGAGSNSGVWLGESRRLARDHRVFAVDLPGEPGGSCEARPPWRGTAYRDWLLEVMDLLRLHATSLLGFSQGGWTALQGAVAAPGRISRLVLLTPGGITRDKAWFAVRAGLFQFLGESGRQRIMRMVFGDEPVPAGLAEYVTLTMREFKPRVGLLPIFTDEELRRVTMPTLVLVGEDDELRPAPAIVARTRRLLPRVTAEIVPGGAHALTNGFDLVAEFLSARPVHESGHPTGTNSTRP